MHFKPSHPQSCSFSSILVSSDHFYTMLVSLCPTCCRVSHLPRLNHQPRPVQYREIEAVIEAVTRRFSELPLPSRAHRRSSVSRRRLLFYPTHAKSADGGETRCFVEEAESPESLSSVCLRRTVRASDATRQLVQHDICD